MIFPSYFGHKNTQRFVNAQNVKQYPMDREQIKMDFCKTPMLNRVLKCDIYFYHTIRTLGDALCFVTLCLCDVEIQPERPIYYVNTLPVIEYRVK